MNKLIAPNLNIIESFIELLVSNSFPCVGAKAASGRKQIEFFIAESIETGSSDIEMTEALQNFASKCSRESLFVSFAVIFRKNENLSEEQFEQFLWQRLQAMHDYDSKLYGWDSKVSSDPESAHFSMSVGGKAFYVVGLHPNASRSARRFPNPVMIFNLHSQFDLLRETGTYAHIRETILERDFKTSGNYNPMLAEHGQSSAAKQYSGRETGKEWKCPFHAKHSG